MFKRRKEGSARCRNGHRDAFCLGCVHSGGFLPLLGRPPHGGLQPRQATLRARPPNAEAHEWCGGDPPLLGRSPRGGRPSPLSRSAAARHGRLAAVQGGVSLPSEERLRMVGGAWPAALAPPQRANCRRRSLRDMSESAAAMGRSPRSGPPRSGSGAGSAFGAMAAVHRSARRAHSSRPAPCARPTPRCSTGNLLLRR